MNTITPSIVAPFIAISHATPEAYQSAEQALNTISQGENGAKLLSKIRDVSTNGKALRLNVVNIESTARPMLTARQAQIHGIPDNEFNVANNEMATSLASKKGFGRKGDGTSAVVDWNPADALSIDHLGRPTLVNDPQTAYASLAHELVHGYRIMKGTYTGGSGNRYDPSTPAGEEENRAVGIGKYSRNKLSENGVREDHGLPMRLRYRAATPPPAERLSPMEFGEPDEDA